MSTILKNRKSAFTRQNGRCCYCGFIMWQTSVEEFAQSHSLTIEQARYFQCTAEHLKARKDGGTNAKRNIAAACLRCNKTRHKLPSQPEPEAYQDLVQDRLKKGDWVSIPSTSRLKSRKPQRFIVQVEHQQVRA